jgi:GalNAc-alpha-(1->4)-GalNAc-alpha-(1->3)-diNAcBac-PP-undecaprenol alpha-1,4-N-acetyl-D-galactosaminyltransferase
MNNKRLCLAIPSLKAGGMERVMSELAAFFGKQDKLEVHIILYGRNPRLFFNVPENVLVHKPEKNFRNKLRFFYTIGRIIFLRRTIRKIDPFSILSFGEYWNSLVMISLYGLKYPVYLSDRCSPEKKFSSFHAILRRWLYPKADGIIAQTEIAGKLLMDQNLNKNIKVIANPVRIHFDKEIKRGNIILSVGRLINTKHHDRLIRIFSKLNAPGWKMMIVGGDDIKQTNSRELIKLVSDLKMEGRIFITGEEKDVATYYKKSRIFAYTSSSEGFPNVIAEALSAGLPVVSYDCIAGPSEMITNGENGYLIPLFNDNEFQEKLQLLIDTEDLRMMMAQKAFQSVEKFSIDTIGQKYLYFILQ